MKKIFILLIVFIISCFMIGCKKNNVKLIVVLDEFDIYVGDELKPHLQVYLSDNQDEMLDDYEILNYNDKLLERQTITIKYSKWQTSIEVLLKEKEVININSHKNYFNYTLYSVDKNNYIQIIEDVKYNIMRRNNTKVIYFADNIIERDKYSGLEIAINKYGRVVEKGIHVSMPEDGMIFSTLQGSEKELENVKIDDFVIYAIDKLYVYRVPSIVKYNDVYQAFIEVTDYISYCSNKEYERVASNLNSLIPLLDSLLDNFDEQMAKTLERALSSLIIKKDITKTSHQYSYSDIVYTEKISSNITTGEYNFFTTYTGKFANGGFRNENMIVKYDASNLIDRNIWGIEVGVSKEGFVVSKDTLVSLPEGGFILSGHTSGHYFILNNIKINDKIVLKNNTFDVYKNSDNSVSEELLAIRNKVVRAINAEKEKHIPHDYKYISFLVDTIDEYIDMTNPEYNNVYLLKQYYKNYKEIEDIINIIYSQLLTYDINQTKGIWYYPFISVFGVNYTDDTSIEGITATLTDLKNMGINEIMFTPFYEGNGGSMVYNSSIYKSYPALDKYDYGIYGHDYLKCFISIAHELGIAVTAYTQTFFAHVNSMLNPDESLYQINFYGNKSKSAAYEVYYYDICSDKVQSLLIDWYKELLEYDFDGFEFDIIRYPDGNMYQYLNVDRLTSDMNIIDHGYTSATINKFLSMYPIAESKEEFKECIIKFNDVRKLWLEFKKEQLTDFVGRLSALIKSTNPKLKISSAVFEDYEHALDAVQQDYKTWITNKYIDKVEPMAYTSNLDNFISTVNEFDNQKFECEIRIGIGAKLSNEDLYVDFQELKYLENFQNYGFILFCTYYYYRDKKYVNILTNNHHYKYISSRNNEEEIISAISIDIIDMVKNYYSELNNKDYLVLISALESNDLNNIKGEILKLEDELMKDNLLKKFSKISN